MMKLHGVIGNVPKLVIISIQYTSIKRAIMKIFSSATYGNFFLIF